MEFIAFNILFFLLVIGLIYAVSSGGGNPTPTQIKNRIVFNRWVKKWKKRLNIFEQEQILGMILLVIGLGMLGLLVIHGSI
jgi:hypothetical protein|tara:strand:+ start:733 stop:975 length:243 start_codon:yes stop_codon:yes gene_type:complete